MVRLPPRPWKAHRANEAGDWDVRDRQGRFVALISYGPHAEVVARILAAAPRMIPFVAMIAEGDTVLLSNVTRAQRLLKAIDDVVTNTKQEVVET